MRQMYDFGCSDCGEVIEKLVHTNVHHIECECGGKAIRMIGMPTVKLEGITGDFPGAAERWARIREDRALANAKKSYAEP